MATTPESKPGTPPCLPKGFSPGDVLGVSPIEGWVGIHTDDLKRWQDSVQDAFDAGFKAAGGSIAPDVMGGGPWKIVEIALDRDEIDVIGKLAEHFSTEPFVIDLVMDVLDGQDCGSAVDALRRFLDKIQIFRRRKP
jgi:hypothetical protein